MSDILHVLKTDEVPSKVDSTSSEGCSILCLGTGKGATALIHGEPSSSYVVLKDNKPVLLVDLGFGVTASYRQYVGKDTSIERVYITHNHADHAAELPVVLAMLLDYRDTNDSHSKRQQLPVVLAAPEVMHRLCVYRVNEICSTNKLEEIAEWRVCEPSPTRTFVDSKKEFEICPIASQHSEVCYGFLLYYRGQLLLGYSGDSGFNCSLYDHLFSAPNVIIDARTNSSYEHAGFADVEKYLSNRNTEGHRVFITGYGVDSEYPDQGVAGCIQLRTGQEYGLNKAETISNVQRTSITMEYSGTLQGVL